MSRARKPAHVPAGAFAVASTLVVVAVGLLDAFTLLGFAHGTWYLAALLLASFARSRRLIVGIAGASIALTVVGAMVSPQPAEGYPLGLAVVNRLGSIVAIAMVAAFLVATYAQRARAALAEAEAAVGFARTTAVADAIPTPLLIFDGRGHLVHRNEAASALFAALGDDRDRRVVDVDDAGRLIPDLSTPLRAALEDGERRSFQSAPVVDGTERSFDVAVVPWSGGATVLVRDGSHGMPVHERARVLETATEHLGAVVSISVFDPYGDDDPAIVFANGALLSETGWSTAAAIGRAPWDRYAEAFVGVDGAPARHVIETALRAGIAWRIELRSVAGGPLRRSLEVDLVTLPSERDDLRHLVLIERDVTGRTHQDGAVRSRDEPADAASSNEPEEGAAPSRDSDTPAPSAVPRVLLVDDDELVLTVIRSQIEALGLSVTALSSSAQALQTYASNPAAFDVLVSDMSMPEMSGAELVAGIRRHAPSLPVLIVTGFAAKAQGAGDLAKGARTALLEKPFTLADLQGALAGIGIAMPSTRPER